MRGYLLAATTTETLLGVLVYLVGLSLSLFVVARLLTGRHSTSTTLLWVGLIVAAPYIGVLAYYLLPHRIHLRRLQRRNARLEEFRAVPGGDTVVVPPPNATSLVGFLDRIDPGVSVPGNEVHLIDTGPAFFDRVADAIREARHFVHIVMYIFRPDATGQRLLELLREAAARGVEVRLLYDHIGSWALGAKDLRALENAGGQTVSYAPLLWRRRPFTLNLRNHRKLVIVDRELAFLGGRNVADEYALDKFGRSGTWFDAMIEIRGPGVLPLQAVFAEDWFHASEEELNDACYYPDPAAADARGCWVGTVASGPDRDRNAHRYVLFEMIGRARETLDISSPYLVPHPTIETALAAASLRGVRIRLYCNGRAAAQSILYHAARARYARLLEVGVELFETDRDYNHAKMFLVDGEALLLGSANLDMRSFELNFELGALIENRELGREVLELFERRLLAARRIERREFAVGPIGRIIDGACRLLSPVL